MAQPQRRLNRSIRNADRAIFKRNRTPRDAKRADLRAGEGQNFPCHPPGTAPVDIFLRGQIQRVKSEAGWHEADPDRALGGNAKIRR